MTLFTIRLQHAAQHSDVSVIQVMTLFTTRQQHAAQHSDVSVIKVMLFTTASNMQPTILTLA